MIAGGLVGVVGAGVVGFSLVAMETKIIQIQ